MRATEARIQALKSIEEGKEIELNRIYEEIKNAANKGLFSINVKVESRYNNYIKEKLIDNGYKFCNIMFEQVEINW